MDRDPPGTNPEEPDSPLAAMISTLADGHPLTQTDKNRMRLHLIDQALNRGVSWTHIGRLYGRTGPEMKRDIHKLRAEVRRQELAQAPEQP